MGRPRKNRNHLENKLIREFFERLDLPNYEGIHCNTLPDGGKDCRMWFFYSLDEDPSLSSRVEDHPHSEIVRSCRYDRNAELEWVGSEKANAWVRRKVDAIFTDLMHRCPGLVSLQVSYARFSVPLPPVHLCVPERWDHVPISESHKVEVIRPHKRNPNAPKGYVVIAFPDVSEEPIEKADPERGTVFKPVRAARELTPEEIEELKQDKILQDLVKRDLAARKYFRFVGGSPFSDECWELIQYPGVCITISCVMPPSTVRQICDKLQSCR